MASLELNEVGKERFFMFLEENLVFPLTDFHKRAFLSDINTTLRHNSLVRVFELGQKEMKSGGFSSFEFDDSHLIKNDGIIEKEKPPVILF